MALLKVQNLGKNENLCMKSVQNKIKMMKRIHLRENLMKIESRTVNGWCTTQRR
jgi:hypothetical protein